MRYLQLALLVAFLPAIILMCAAPGANGVELGGAMMGEWTFEEKSGTTARDTSDNNNNGTLMGGAARVDGGIGRAVSLDGVDGFVDCGNSATLDITEEISLEAWLYPMRITAGEPLIVGKGPYSYGLHYYAGGVWFYISDGSWKCSASVPLKEWTHVVGTYDGKNMRLYVNGELSSSFIMEAPRTPIKSSGSPVLIGKHENAFFHGMIDDVRVYKQTLSEGEIKSHYDERKKLLKDTGAVSPEKLKGLARRVYDAGESRKTLVIDSQELVDSDLTIPSNLVLKFEAGGTIAVSEGVTLTIRGPVESPLVQIFEGSGKVVFGSGRVEKVYPQWWGAQGNGTADDTSAIQAAIDAWPSGGLIAFPQGDYTITSTLRFNSGSKLEGPATLKAKTGLPAMLQSSNPAARTSGISISRMSFSGTGVDGARCEVGIDFTNTCSSLIEYVNLSGCVTGIKMDGPIFCGYNNLIGLSIGNCRTGIEMSNSTIKTTLLASNIGAVDTGLLLNTTNQLDVFGLSIEVFKVGVDVVRGDTVHLYGLYFANMVESGTGIRIAPSVTQCTVVSPRYSRVATQIDNQSPDTIILDDEERSELLRTKALYTYGLSASDTPANNLRGSATISGTEMRATVTFDKAEIDAVYFAVATVTASEGSPAAGSGSVRIESKTKTGFDLVLAESPGENSSVRIDWIIVR